MSEAPLPESVRYRLTRWQRGMPFLPMAVMGVAFQVLLWIEGIRPPGLTDMTAFWIVMPLLGVIVPPHFGITLTQSAAVVHNLRRRTIPWGAVQAIQVEALLGTRTVVIYEAGGRRTRLRAPTTGFLSRDREFEAKFHTIGRWWLDHRGPDWSPVPPPWSWEDGRPTPEWNPFAPPR